jgi:hypothetical protein
MTHLKVIGIGVITTVYCAEYEPYTANKLGKFCVLLTMRLDIIV